MTHNYSKLSAGLLTLSLTFGASAANAEGFSLGLSAARAPINLEDAGTSFGGDADGFRVFGSYMLTRNFGVEGGLSKYGTPDDSSIPPELHVDTEAYDIYAVAAYPLSNNFDLIGKVGYVSWNTETEVNDTNETHYKSDDLALSFGGEYDVSKHFGIRGELEWFDSMVSGDLKYSLSAVIAFK